MKPIDEQKFTEVMDRAICQIRSKKNVEPLVIKVGGNYVRIPVDDILYAENQARKLCCTPSQRRSPTVFMKNGSAGAEAGRSLFPLPSGISCESAGGRPV